MNGRQVQQLVRLVEAKDTPTAAHTWRVTLYTQALAETYALATNEVQRLMRAAALHDVGKLDVPDAILAKPGPLSDDEWRIVRMHPVYGDERLRQMGETDPYVLQLVRWHHERLDGTGYPDGLSGMDVPRPAKVFAVIDAFDAMTSLRPYRPVPDADAVDRAIGELQSHAGAWYCRDAVERFVSLVRAGRLNWIMEHYNDRASLSALDM